MSPGEVPDVRKEGNFLTSRLSKVIVLQTYRQKDALLNIGRVSYLIYISMRRYVLTTSSDIVVCFYATVCLGC